MKDMCQPGGINQAKFATNSKMVWNFIISIDDKPKSYGNDKIRMVEDYNENASGMESQR